MNCIRCGRAVSDAQSFCTQCRQVISEPLVPSPYLNTRIQIQPPNQKTAEAKHAEPKRSRRRAASQRQKPPRAGRGLRAALALLSVLCAALLALGAYALTQYSDWQRDKNRLHAQQTQWQHLSAQNDTLTQQLEQERSERASLSDLLAQQERELERLERDIAVFQSYGGETESAVQTLQEDNLRLSEQLQQAAQDAYRLNARVQELEQQAQTLQAQAQALQEKSDFVDEYVVFVENNGTDYYHRYECSEFARGSFWVYHLSAAIARDYLPCPYCR